MTLGLAMSSWGTTIGSRDGGGRLGRRAGRRALARGALVRGRRLTDPVSPADFALVLADGRRRSGRTGACAGRTSGSRATGPTRWTPCGRPRRAAGERVEVACRGGVGRTGTALAALAVLDGLAPARRRGVGARASTTRAPSRHPGSAGGCARSAEDTPDRGNTAGARPLRCLHNYTGGEWSRLRSGDQGKRAEEGNDELVNHPLQKTQAPIPISATSLSLPDGS